MKETLDLIAVLALVALAAGFVWRRLMRPRAGKDCGGCGRCGKG